MNKLLILSLIAAVFLLACDREELNVAPEVSDPNISLNYDDDNLTAPRFDGGTYEGAALFPGSLVSNYDDSKIQEVHYFIQDLPSSCSVKIYTGSSQGTPETLLYSAVTTNDISANSWNIHQVTRDITLSDQDIWVAIQFSHIDQQATLGCDPGPADENGDWVSDGGQWSTLRDLTGQININWNVRAIIAP